MAMDVDGRRMMHRGREEKVQEAFLGRYRDDS